MTAPRWLRGLRPRLPYGFGAKKLGSEDPLVHHSRGREPPGWLRVGSVRDCCRSEIHRTAIFLKCSGRQASGKILQRKGDGARHRSAGLRSLRLRSSLYVLRLIRRMPKCRPVAQSAATTASAGRIARDHTNNRHSSAPEFAYHC